MPWISIAILFLFDFLFYKQQHSLIAARIVLSWEIIIDRLTLPIAEHLYFKFLFYF